MENITDILVIDDEENMRYMLQLTLETEGYAVTLAAEGHEALDKIAQQHFDFIICDVKMPGMSGLDVLTKVMASAPDTPVILISAYGTVDTAIEAMKQGAYDYLMKPFKQDEILLTLKKAEERERLRQENRLLRQEVEQKYSFENIIGKSSHMQDIFRTIEKIASYKSTVLITGESGTGKELVARAIHYSGIRRAAPFVPINCGAIPHDLLETELFGHVKGAFTGAIAQKAGLIVQADRGTLFLDEIGDLPLDLQVKLLRVLQEGELRPVGDTRTMTVDVRVIAATSRNLSEDAEQGKFRKDLFYRLNVVPVHVPPLRERREDIVLLIRHFLKKHAREMGKPIPEMSPEAMKLLLECRWRGNVRELENVLERTVVMTESGMITPEHLPSDLFRLESDILLKIPDARISLKALMPELTRLAEKEMILRALQQTQNNRTKAAQLLEISHRALMYKLKEYRIS